MGMHRVLWNFKEGVREGHQAPLGSRHVRRCFTLAQWVVFFFLIFIYLATPGLSCDMQDLVPWWGIEPWPPAGIAGSQPLDHQHIPWVQFWKTLEVGEKTLEAGGEGDDRGWDGWMASPTQGTWVWASSGSWWWTGRPGMLQSIGLQSWTRLSDWTELRSWRLW